MCGIVGYIGKQPAQPILLTGLQALEYRGYDSAGLAVAGAEGVRLARAAGPVRNLERTLEKLGGFEGFSGLAHTRWATHGRPDETNAHPHCDCQGMIFLVHNGIVENYRELKNYLLARSHQFRSETDTETIAHLLEDFLSQGLDFRRALYNTLKTIQGAYGLAIIDARQPEVLYAARRGSPLVVGLGEDENFLASDPSALVGRTKRIAFLNDGQVAEISRSAVKLTDLNQQPTPLEISKLEWTLEQAQKGDFPHFMLKEIFEGPEVIRMSLKGRLIKDGAKRRVRLGGLSAVADHLRQARRLLILACGTSYYAGLIGEYLFEEIANLSTEVHFASEFHYRRQPFEPGTAALCISQSGETADTLAALREAKKQGLLTLGLVNVVGSTIARETEAGVYNHAGPEIGVASTKAFLSQTALLALWAASIAEERGLSCQEILEELENLPDKIQRILAGSGEIKKLAEKYRRFSNFLFLGRRYNYPTALEGALKLKEISYVHAEGYGAGEMKHGPLAMIGPDFPTVALMPQNSVSDKMRSNLQEIKARGGPIILIGSQGDAEASFLADDHFLIPPTLEPLEPLLTVVPLQLLAYFIGVGRGFNVDKPRNLAKSVTVE